MKSIDDVVEALHAGSRTIVAPGIVPVIGGFSLIETGSAAAHAMKENVDK
jgi:hypothetical protein